MQRISRQLLKGWFPKRRPSDNKGRFGHVLVVAGSRGMSGAAVLTAQAAARAGAGLVTLAIPRSQQSIVARQLKEVLTVPLAETSRGALSPLAVRDLEILSRKRRFNALALGPGLSQDPGTVRAVPRILQRIPLPAVVDADALNALARLSPERAGSLLRGRLQPTAVTPHPGEAGRLLGMTATQVQADRGWAAGRLAGRLGAICVLKGHGTLVQDGARCWFNPTGNPGLAKGGSGDVLAGLIAGYLAQILASGVEARTSLRRASLLGVYLHGLAGDLGARELTQACLLPSDLLAYLPKAVQTLLR